MLGFLQCSKGPRLSRSIQSFSSSSEVGGGMPFKAAEESQRRFDAICLELINSIAYIKVGFEKSLDGLLCNFLADVSNGVHLLLPCMSDEFEARDDERPPSAIEEEMESLERIGNRVEEIFQSESANFSQQARRAVQGAMREMGESLLPRCVVRSLLSALVQELNLYMLRNERLVTHLVYNLRTEVARLSTLLRERASAAPQQVLPKLTYHRANLKPKRKRNGSASQVSVSEEIPPKSEASRETIMSNDSSYPKSAAVTSESSTTFKCKRKLRNALLGEKLQIKTMMDDLLARFERLECVLSEGRVGIFVLGQLEDVYYVMMNGMLFLQPSSLPDILRGMVPSSVRSTSAGTRRVSSAPPDQSDPQDSASDSHVIQPDDVMARILQSQRSKISGHFATDQQEMQDAAKINSLMERLTLLENVSSEDSSNNSDTPGLEECAEDKCDFLLHAFLIQALGHSKHWKRKAESGGGRELVLEVAAIRERYVAEMLRQFREEFNQLVARLKRIILRYCHSSVEQKVHESIAQTESLLAGCSRVIKAIPQRVRVDQSNFELPEPEIVDEFHDFMRGVCGVSSELFDRLAPWQPALASIECRRTLPRPTLAQLVKTRANSLERRAAEHAFMQPLAARHSLTNMLPCSPSDSPSTALASGGGGHSTGLTDDVLMEASGEFSIRSNLTRTSDSSGFSGSLRQEIEIRLPENDSDIGITESTGLVTYHCWGETVTVPVHSASSVVVPRKRAWLLAPRMRRQVDKIVTKLQAMSESHMELVKSVLKSDWMLNKPTLANELSPEFVHVYLLVNELISQQIHNVTVAVFSHVKSLARQIIQHNEKIVVKTTNFN